MLKGFKVIKFIEQWVFCVPQTTVKVLPFFRVDEKAREYRIWQRDTLASKMDSKNKVEQKIDYIHRNPLNEKWNLAKRPEQYKWSSAKYYEDGEDVFGILTHYTERF